jgi:hypothetical protein
MPSDAKVCGRRGQQTKEGPRVPKRAHDRGVETGEPADPDIHWVAALVKGFVKKDGAFGLGH